ncbi:MAG TPA: GNAT family N-acetyltransferase [Nakamurella sp.]
MDLQWLDPTALDRRDVDGVTAVFEAARAVDRPDDPVCLSTTVAADLIHGWDDEPARTAVTRDGRGRVIGVLQIRASEWDNRHLADVGLTVDPSARRRGIGSELFAAGVASAAADGRTLVTAASFEGGPGTGFAKSMGLDRASEEVRREQDLTGVDWPGLDALATAAAAHHADYEIAPMEFPTPTDLLSAIGEMAAAINDAPLDDLDMEDEVFTPNRIQAFERAQVAYGRRMHRLVARYRPTGELAGHTVVLVEAAQPWHANQLDTSVVRAHRGHRLGLALKIGMLRLLAEREPQARVIRTWNAASNAHMIAVNEQLGYRPVARVIDWQKHL